MRYQTERGISGPMKLTFGVAGLLLHARAVPDSDFDSWEAIENFFKLHADSMCLATAASTCCEIGLDKTLCDRRHRATLA